MSDYTNVFYFRYINAIGGIETFLYNMAVKYGKDFDITIMYGDGDPVQLQRLRQLVRVKHWSPRDPGFSCERLFCNFNLEIVSKVDAPVKVQIAHGDYKAMKLAPNIHPEINQYLGVSRQVCETYEEVTGHHTDLVYEPVIVNKPRKVLHLISASRLSREKGKERMKKLMAALDAYGQPYVWYIFTDARQDMENPHIVYRKPDMNVIDFVADADYLVQLSDNEGYCYSVVESLCVGTPVIVTECPVFNEIGVKEGVNGFFLDFEMKKADADFCAKLYKGVKKFTYTPIEDRWREWLVPGGRNYQDELNEMVDVECVREYFDMQLNRMVYPPEVITVNRPRAEQICEASYGRMKQ